MSSARLKAAKSAVNSEKKYDLNEAINVLLGLKGAQFKESVDVAIKLGIDARQSDQGVRGSCQLPHGLGKTVSVAVFAVGEAAEKARAAGADHVGMEELAELFKKDSISVDLVIASPDAMRLVGQLGPVLGPKGLMPNPKDGTVSADVASATQAAKAGKVRFRNDSGGIIHCGVGRVDFKPEDLAGNIRYLVSELARIKPPASKGRYLRACFISTTMGPGIEVDLDTI